MAPVFQIGAMPFSPPCRREWNWRLPLVAGEALPLHKAPFYVLWRGFHDTKNLTLINARPKKVLLFQKNTRLVPEILFV